MKYIYYLLLIFLVINLSACESNGLIPGSTQTQPVLLNIKQYLGIYTDVNQNQIRGLDISIDVDLLNSQGEITANFKSYFFQRTNEQLRANHFFDIELPIRGSYAITIVSYGSECYDFCSTNGCSVNTGKPRFRTVRTFMNTTEPPPVLLEAVLTATNCN